MWAAACCSPAGLQPRSLQRPSLPLVEQSLRQNRSQLRMPQYCAESYLSADTIELLRKEIGLQTPAAAG